MKRYEEKKAVVSFGEAVRVAECMKDGFDVERVWLVSSAEDVV